MNDAVLSANIFSKDYFDQITKGYSLSEQFMSLEGYESSVIVISSNEEVFNYISTQSMFDELKLGTAAYRDSSTVGLRVDVEALKTSGNYWDAAYATANLITSAYNAENWNNAFITTNLITSAYFGSNWDEAC